MPEPGSSAQSSQLAAQAPEVAQQMSETFMASAMQIMSANSYTPTQAQVDKMLSLQEKGMDFTHHERTHFSPQLISTLLAVGGLALIIVGLFVFCVFYAPEYASQIIALGIGLITGSVGGYGYGSRAKKKNGDED